jgi:cytochrome bd-type quinol oxidase subunit 2
MRRLRYLVMVLASMAVLLAPATPALAATDPFGGVCSNPGTSDAAVCKDKTTKNPITGPNGLIIKATRVLAVIAGVAAVIMIIVSGLRYILSEGDPAKASQARNGLIYALVGLIVIIAAQSIITFVIDRIYQ